MAGRDARLEMQARARQDAAETHALAEVRAAAVGMRDARELNDKDLMKHAARRGARVDPALLPARWAVWVRDLRHAFAVLEAADGRE